jgi:hypothetical protein
MHQDWLSYLTVTKFGTNTEQMPIKFLITTGVARISDSIPIASTFVPSYWISDWFLMLPRVFSNSSYQPVDSVVFAPVQFVSGGEA